MDRRVEQILTGEVDAWEAVPLLAADAPELLVGLVVEGVKADGVLGTMLEAACNVLPDDALPEVAAAVMAVVRERGFDDPFEVPLLLALGAQGASTLHPHLHELWGCLGPPYWMGPLWPWRDAGDAEVHWLVQRLRDGDDDEQLRAFGALLETRTDAGWSVVEDELAAGRPVGRDEAVLLGEVGAAWIGNAPLLRTELPSAAHLDLRAGPLVPVGRTGPDDALLHPTWRLGTPVVGRVVLGGMEAATCRWCEQPLHRLVRFEAPPPGLDVPSRIVCCRRCWSVDEQHFVHDGETIRPLATGDPQLAPDLHMAPLPEVEAALRATPPRWRFQEWGMSDARGQNLCRVGGHVAWVQDSRVPICTGCDRPMVNVLQLDSFDGREGGGWYWGSGGLLYAHWCAACRRSAVTMQWT
jgi:hypothetical protein